MGQILLRKKADIDAELNKIKEEESKMDEFKKKSFGNMSTKEKDELLELIAIKLGIIK